MADYIYGVSVETKLFLISCLIGVGFGICYDILRIIRIIIPHKKVFVFIEDFFFMLFCAFWYFLFINDFAKGRIRVFLLIGIALGSFIYLFSIGNLTKRLAKVLHKLFAKVYFKVKYKFITPIYTKVRQKICEKQTRFIKNVKSRKKSLKAERN